MEPAPLDPAEHVRRLRQQLILAQVRVMEMEDARDTAEARLAETESLVAAAQRLADSKLDEAAHLARTLSDLQAEYQHLRHIQHLTNEALGQARADLAAAQANLDDERRAHTVTQQSATDLRQQLAARETALGDLRSHHETLLREAAARAERIVQLDAELRALKFSRSWRWMAWLRSLERALGRR